MKKPPCEWRVRELIPVIRASMARVLVKNYGYSIYQASKVLGVTPAAISNYLTSKRSRTGLVEELLSNEHTCKIINDYVSKVVQGRIDVGDALCELCRILASTEVIKKAYSEEELGNA